MEIKDAINEINKEYSCPDLNKLIKFYILYFFIFVNLGNDM